LLRGIFEKLCATVQWYQSNQTITAVKGDFDVWLKLGSKNVKVNGVSKTIDVPAQTINWRTLVPLRLVSEVFDAQVSWSSATIRIDILYHRTMPAKQMKVHYIDVGQGESIYMKGPEGKDIIIDAGGKGKGDED
jgi:competence protein ComEC